MTPVQTFELVIVMMAIVIPLEVLARRLRLPPAAAFILGGMVLALLPGLRTPHLDPDLVLVLFMPPLLMAGAYFTAWRDFRANLRVILQLAVGAVAFTTLVVGVVAHLVVPGIPWAVCFALGAVVSPPDAVAAKAVLQGLRLPPRVVLLLEGESLVNDASGLVLFRLAVAAALTGTFSILDAAGSFGLLAVGGVIVGAAFGYAAATLLARLATEAAIVASLLVAWVSYIGSEALGVSGVLSTVACGLVMGQRQHGLLSAAARTSAGAVWRIVVFTLESLIFVLIGLALRGVLARVGGGTVGAGLGSGMLPGVAAVVAAVVLSRFAWIFPAVYLQRLLSSRPGTAAPPASVAPVSVPPASVPLVMSWAGMRGVVSLAAALSLPEQLPGRDFVLVATFAVILVTVLVQGSTLGPLIRLVGLDRLPSGRRGHLSENAARAQLWQAQVEAVRGAATEADGTVRHPRLLEQYEYRARIAQQFGALPEQDAPHPERIAHFDVVLAAIAAARLRLLALHREGEVHDAVLSELEQELDLEEVTALRHRGGD